MVLLRIPLLRADNLHGALAHLCPGALHTTIFNRLLKDSFIFNLRKINIVDRSQNLNLHRMIQFDYNGL